MSFFKYHAGIPGSAVKTGDPACLKAAETGAVLADWIGIKCWAVNGARVWIGPQTDSDEHGFAIMNFNFSQNGRQPSVPTNLGLAPLGSIGRA